MTVSNSIFFSHLFHLHANEDIMEENMQQEREILSIGSRVALKEWFML